jgi:hypothetical protein
MEDLIVCDLLHHFLNRGVTAAIQGLVVFSKLRPIKSTQVKNFTVLAEQSPLQCLSGCLGHADMDHRLSPG